MKRHQQSNTTPMRKETDITTKPSPQGVSAAPIGGTGIRRQPRRAPGPQIVKTCAKLPGPQRALGKERLDSLNGSYHTHARQQWRRSFCKRMSCG
jgi:hypothetical protein